jgi:hypothetical protein
VVVAVLFAIGWFASGGLTPRYDAAAQDWTNWADTNKWNARISAFAMLVAAFIFVYFMSLMRGVLESAGSQIRGSSQLARAAFAGALIGVTAMSMALIWMAAASSEGANAKPVVTLAVTTGAAAPYLVAAMGFAAFLIATGILTLRTRVFALWTGIVALAGGVSFLITFLTILDGTSNGSSFGYGFFPGVAAFVTWTIAASIALYRSAAT